MSAPEGNQNSMRHGLTAGALPKGGGYIQKVTAQLRRAIEQATLEVRGQLGPYEAAVVQTAIRWERHAMLAQRWLKKHYDELDPEQRLNFSREIAKASESRDRCLKLLGLDGIANQDDFNRLYGSPVTAALPHRNGDHDKDTDEAGDAPAAVLCDVAGNGAPHGERASSEQPNIGGEA